MRIGKTKYWVLYTIPDLPLDSLAYCPCSTFMRSRPLYHLIHLSSAEFQQRDNTEELFRTRGRRAVPDTQLREYNPHQKQSVPYTVNSMLGVLHLQEHFHAAWHSLFRFFTGTLPGVTDMRMDKASFCIDMVPRRTAGVSGLARYLVTRHCLRASRRTHHGLIFPPNLFSGKIRKIRTATQHFRDLLCSYAAALVSTRE